ncbi:hypothetical protein H072_1927 [Dactylellina haptotyla CBS 200.50]|uniref:Phosphatidylinositol-glycan-specific phospholipase D n=1 Tax=Dactylellina haptotyla (strain CBS 200.50) TaxID=1284197 RepID=S8ASV8_DACHA|nr:hypothetical protein H072_1927 [Dactylellina haptotyla CBS 200.50]
MPVPGPSRISSLICTYLSLSIGLFTQPSTTCGVLTHNEILRRARSLYSIAPASSPNDSPFQLHHAHISRILSQESTHPAAQAGAFFPDWGYGCFSNDVPSEAAHWPPFIVAAIRYFHKTYGPLYIALSRPPSLDRHDGGGDQQPAYTKNTLWPNGTLMTDDDQSHKDNLLTFIFSVSLHASSDATWHSLKMYNGFIRMVAGLDFAASYNDAHSLVDTGGDIILAHRQDGIPDSKNWVESSWWIPTTDILAIYESMGITTVNRFSFSFCVARGLAAMRAVVSAGGGLYDRYVEQSPAMVDFFDEYYLGGMDEMAGNAVWCWRNLTEWMWTGAGGDESDGWDLCDTFKLIKSRNGGKIEPPDPPLLPFGEQGSEVEKQAVYTHRGVYAQLIQQDGNFADLVERYMENIYQEENVRLGSVRMAVPDNMPYFDDEEVLGTAADTMADDGDKFRVPHPTPSPFPGSFGDPVYLSTGKAFSKFGSYLSIGNHGTKQILDGVTVDKAQGGSVELTASAFVETEDQDYVAGGAVYSIDLKEVLKYQPVQSDWRTSEGRVEFEFFKVTGRSDYHRVPFPAARTQVLCQAKASLGSKVTVLEIEKQDTTGPSHPNARFGAATTPLRLKSGVYNVVTAPGPKIFNESSPRIGFIPAGYLDVFKGPQRILRLSFEDLPGGERVGEREFGSVILAADVDGDGEEEVILGMPFADGNRSGCGVQLAEGEVAVVKMGLLVENALNGCDQIVDGAVVRVNLPEWEKKGEACNQNTYEWFGRSLVWAGKSKMLGIGAPGRGKIYFWKWDEVTNGMKHDFTIWGPEKEGFGRWGVESGVSPGGHEWVVVGTPNDDHQIGYLRVFRIIDGEGVLVAKVRSKEGEKYGKFGMVLRGVDSEGGLWVGSPWAEGEKGAVWWVDIGAIADFDGNWKHSRVRNVKEQRQAVIGESMADLVREFTTKALLSGPEEKAHFGASLAVVDINGDRRSDLLVGIPYSGVTATDESARFHGAVAVFAKIFRRLASEHAAINACPPPDYIVVESPHDDLFILDVTLIGPVGTPYESGAFRLSIKCTDTYPSSPPTANFKTKIWHPNVDEKSGEVCVDTLKTSWTPTTKLRDVLEVIRSLLIHPNPSSALNSEAGLLAEEDYKAFSRQAKLMTKIYASIPADLKNTVKSMRQKADEEGRAASAAAGPAAPTTPVAKHRKNASSSSSLRRPGSSSSTKRAADDHPSALSIPPRDSTSHADNALHTPTKEHINNQATPYTSTPHSHKSHHAPKSSIDSTNQGKENTNTVFSPSSTGRRSRSSSPLGKRTFDEANEEGSLETDIRGEVDRSMSPPPAKRRSVEIERPEALKAMTERPKKVPRSVVYSKGMGAKAKGIAPKGLKRL